MKNAFSQALKEADAERLRQDRLRALQSMYLLTLEMTRACAKEDTDRLTELLDQRQRLMERVDALSARLQAGGGAEYSEAEAARLRDLYGKLEEADAYVRRAAQEKLDEYSAVMREARKMKQGMRAYICNVRQVDGMYFDSRK